MQPTSLHDYLPARRPAAIPPCLPDLQARLLGGQKLQGVLTSNEVQAILARKGWQSDYPLFTTGEAGVGCLPAWLAAWLVQAMGSVYGYG